MPAPGDTNRVSQTRNDQSRLTFERDGADWPNREASRFVDTQGLRFHVQMMGAFDGAKPAALLLHGTGAATHSWRGLAPALAQSFDVVAPDLPGHGFSGMPAKSAMSLPGMARAVTALLDTLNVQPSLIVGHSAGAAILARMVVDGLITPRLMVSLNGAFVPFRGLAGQVFSPMARVLASSSLVPRLFEWRAAQPGVVEGLLRNTGSKIDARGVELYGRLVRNRGHLDGALQMMANWDLGPLFRDLPKLRVPLLLIVGGDDGTISSADAFAVRDSVPGARLEYVRGLGHLAHEEAPGPIAALISAAYAQIAQIR